MLQNSQEKKLYWSLFLIKLQASGPATLLKDTPANVLSSEFNDFLRASCLQSTSGRLLLDAVRLGLFIRG